MHNNKIANQLYGWAKDLFPINRSITGSGVRQTLRYLKNIVPQLEMKSVKSGVKAFDWVVPKEWNVKDAYIISPNGEKIAWFKENNLHLMGYSIPINKKVGLSELRKHIFTLPDLPDAIPYITSYYSKDWGFCITENQKKQLIEGEYEVVIESELKDGELNYGELIINGRTTEEILISTYICHPSMANNELSGPIVTIKLVEWLLEQVDLKYTYRIVFVPETIGSIIYINKNIDILKKHVIGGFVVTCVGDDNNYSLLKTKNEDNILDRIGEHVLKYHTDNNYKKFSFLDRGSDERQYSSVGVDIPMISLMRSKYGEYKEYHTSLDNLDFISPEGLLGGFEIHKKAIRILESNCRYKTNTICEPQLGKRGLYPLKSTKQTHNQVKTMMDIIAYSDGSMDLLSLAERINVDFFVCEDIVNNLLEYKIMMK